MGRSMLKVETVPVLENRGMSTEMVQVRNARQRNHLNRASKKGRAQFVCCRGFTFPKEITIKKKNAIPPKIVHWRRYRLRFKTVHCHR
jgi:hypothetical protein